MLTPVNYVAATAFLAFLYRSLKRPKKQYITNLHLDVQEYDAIIVGGGTAGCALAARLSEDPAISVLLIEAGGSGTALVTSRTPSMFTRLFGTQHVYNFRTEPQINAKDKREYFPRAKLLGGCSSINAQMAQYGDPQDFNEWASIIGDDSWAWKNFNRYFRKFERYQSNPAHPQVNPSLHGRDGPVKIGFYNVVSLASNAFVEACVNVGIPFTADFNTSAGTVGAGRIMTYIDERRQRVSAESAYLTPSVLARKNLKVIIHATVTRILLQDDKTDGLRAVGVEFANSPDGPRYRARARRDVIISAGAIHSPHILKLSGIGPAEELERNGIPVALNLPAVGENLVDHPVVHLNYKELKDTSLKYLNPKNFSEATRAIFATVRYFLGFGGPLATNFGETAAFIRSDNVDLYPLEQYPERFPDNTSGPDAPDLELFFTPIAVQGHGRFPINVPSLALHCYLLRPLSRGHVLLKTANPFDLPSVDPNYLQDAADRYKLLRGVKILLRIARSEPLASFLDHSCTQNDLDHQGHLKSDEELIDLIRTRVETIYHPASTCRMAPANQGGVVDTKLRIYGVKGLRVCDASVFPSIVSGHTAGACLAIAEKFADELKAEYST